MRIQNRQSRLNLFLLLLPILFIITGCVTAKQKKLEAGFQPLTGAELQTLFSQDRTGVFVSEKNGMVTKVNMFKDGSQTATNEKLDDKGHWRIVGDEFGSKWTKIRGGSEEFSTWFPVGDNKYEVYNRGGTFRGVITVN